MNTWSLPSDATVYDGLALMAEKDIGALLVKDGDRVRLKARDVFNMIVEHAHATGDNFTLPPRDGCTCPAPTDQPDSPPIN